jgi:two-component sensor histidine kinase
MKYGALTMASGEVSITWTIEDREGGPNFVFLWRELGGPPASQPASVGFGSRLISRVLQDDFRGTVQVTYESTGLVCRLTTPVENLASPTES